MRSNLLIAPLFAVSIVASPCKKSNCNADDCLRAVRATNAEPFASSATADCSSFMQKTVTPCAITSTTTHTVTATDSAAIVTATAIENDTQFLTVVHTLTSNLAIEDTATIVRSSTAVVTEVIETPVTVTAAPIDKRTGGALALPTMPAALKGADNVRRTASVVISPSVTITSAGTCAATTNAPIAVPTYASACSGTASYSSACSCAGMTGGTTTLSASTVISTTTSTVYDMPTSTLTATLTNIASTTAVATTIVPATFETTDATLIIPTAVTLTTELVVPTTVVVSPPTCSVYNFVATSGTYAGQFLTGVTPDPNVTSYGFVEFISGAGSAQAFALRSDGTIYSADNVYGWVSTSENLYYILQMTDSSRSAYGSETFQMVCTIGAGDSSFPGTIGTLSCEVNGQATSLVSCASTINNLIQSSRDYGAMGCATVNLAAIPACS